MRGLYKATGASQTIQSRRDYQKLCEIGREIRYPAIVPSVPKNAGWRTFDKAAQVGVERMLAKFPHLRVRLMALYPGFVKAEPRIAQEDPSKCQTCQKQGAEPAHICPFQADFWNNEETLCNCCLQCTYQCEMDI